MPPLLEKSSLYRNSVPCSGLHLSSGLLVGLRCCLVLIVVLPFISACLHEVVQLSTGILFSRLIVGHSPGVLVTPARPRQSSTTVRGVSRRGIDQAPPVRGYAGGQPHASGQRGGGGASRRSMLMLIQHTDSENMLLMLMVLFFRAS